MHDLTTGTDTRDPRPMDRPLLGFDLAAEVAALRAEPAWAEYGRTAKTLAKSATFRVVVALLRAGGSIGDDDVSSPMSVQVLSGAIRAERGTDESSDVPSGGLVWFEAGPSWRVTAIDDAALLLAITWSPDRASGPDWIEETSR